MRRIVNKMYSLIIAGIMLFPVRIFAHGSEEEHQREGLLANYMFIGTIILLIILLLLAISTNIKLKQLNNLKKKEGLEKRKKLEKMAFGLKIAAIVAGLAVIVSGIASLSGRQAIVEEAQSVAQVVMDHGHGMGYSPDGSKLIFAVHDGLRIYQNGQWIIPAGEKHDYMGFSMADDGFYSSGHPAPGSDKKNPFGVVKSTDEGKSFESLALYGEVDFHGMSVGYKSHAIYVFNPQPNSEMRTTGLYYSTDEAKTWMQSEAQNLAGQPAAIAVHPADEAIVAVGTDQGVFVSKDHGRQFERLGADMQVTSLFFNPQGALYAGGVNHEAGLYRIDLDLKEMNNFKLPPITQQDAIAFIAQNPANDQEIAFMTYNKDVFVTSDQGSNWTKIVDQGKGESASH